MKGAVGASFRALLTALALLGAGGACVARALGPPPAPLAPDPAIRFGRLPNGIRYAIRANPEPKGRASLRFLVAAGSLEEREDQRGLAHFLEHMAFNGSAHFPAGTLVEYFQRLGMSFGGDANAYTSFDRTEYQIELPDNRPATLDRALGLFADYAGGLLLPPSGIAKERGIILSEERYRDSADYRAYVDELRFLLPGSLLPERMPIGLDPVIRNSGRDRFADFYDAWYRPENVVVAAVGDFDPADVEARLVRVLGPVRAHGPARPRPDLGAPEPAQTLRVRLHSDPEAPQLTVEIEQIAPLALVPDTAARRLERMRRDLALYMLNRRLEIRSKEDGAPFLSGEADVSDQFNLFRNASIGLTCRPAQWKEALGVAEQELRRAIGAGFEPAELREALAQMRNDLEQAVREQSTRKSRDLADAFVNGPLDREIPTTPAQDLALLGPALTGVTPEECRSALASVWNAGPGRFVFLAGNLSLAHPDAEIAAAYEASRAVPVRPVADAGEATFAYSGFGAPGTVAASRTLTEPSATLLTLSNGVRLDVKRTAFEAGSVSVSVRVGGGLLSAPPAQEGLPFLASSAFLDGGLGRHGYEDLQRILAGRTVDTGFEVGDDAFVFTGATSRADLALQFQVICAYLTDPGYRPDGLRQFRKGIEPFYAELDHTDDGPLRRAVPRLEAGGDPRFGIPDRKALEARSYGELRAWLAPQFASGPIEVAVVGDVDEEAVIAAAVRTFGALPARAPKPAYAAQRRLPPAGPAQARTFRVETDIPRGTVEFAWPATDGRDRHLARRIALLTSILDDRLRVRLREQMGGTYSPEAGADLGETFPGFGWIEAQAKVEPARADEVAEAIRAVARSLARDGITDDELKRAREPLLTSIRTSERSNAYWLEVVLASAQEHPEHLDWSRTRRADFESATKEDLDRLARAYLDPSRAWVFLSLPQGGRPGL